MSGECAIGLFDPGLRRDFLRHMIERRGKALNGSHLFLAGILARQNNWHFHRPFARTIFTTNFDPLLQRSLQLAHKLYYMTDDPGITFRPESESGEAIHLVYLHGSIHRYRLCNTAAEIASARSNEAAALRGFLERRGLIVVGYGGWNDAMMAALSEADSFDGNLYWCDRHSPDLAADLMAPPVTRLLERLGDNAFYVQIPDASMLLVALHRGLGLGALPEFMVNPFGSVIAELREVDLSDVGTLILVPETPRGLRADDDTGEPLLDSMVDETSTRPDAPEPEHAGVADSLAQLRDRTVTRLIAAEDYFLRLAALTPPAEMAQAHDPAAKAGEIAALVNEALLSWYSANYPLALEIWRRIADDNDAPLAERVKARLNRGMSFERLGQPQLAIGEYSRVIIEALANDELRSAALTNRGILLDAAGDSEGADRDFSAVIGRGVAGEAARAMALNNRGLSRVRRGDFEAGIEDFDQVLQDEESPSAQRATAYFNRGTSFSERGDAPTAIDSFTRGLAEEGVSPHLRGRLLYNRAVVRGDSDPQGALSDYDALLRSGYLTPYERARTLHNRGVINGSLGNQPQALADYTAAVEMEDAPVEIRAEALQARAHRKNRLGRREESLDDHLRLIQWADAPLRLREQSRFNRAVLLSDMGQGGELPKAELEVLGDEASDLEIRMRARALRGENRATDGRRAEALGDFDAVIAWEGAPVVRARAFAGRGWLRFAERPDQPAEAIADNLSALQLHPALPVARANLGLAYLHAGEVALAEREYRRAVSELEDPARLREVLQDLEKYPVPGSSARFEDLIRGKLAAIEGKAAAEQNS
jgi:tetratricopeptide (TPR) repeat protein